MPVNAGYEYFNAEKVYLAAQTLDEKIAALEEMIRAAPKHKSSENLLAELKTRLKKFREKSDKAKKTGRGKPGLKKEGYQVVFVGLPNSGKSSLLATLTNARPAVSAQAFTTYEPIVGTMDYGGVKAQIVDLPSIGSTAFDIGLVNTADCVALVVERPEELAQIDRVLSRASGKRIIVITKIDLLESSERRKLEERCKAKRLFPVFVSSVTGEGVEELKKRIFERMDMIRVYTKEPGKPSSGVPVVLARGSLVRDVAESILKGFSSRVKEAKVTGPSAKFANQKVGLMHELKDMDVVEFHTR